MVCAGGSRWLLLGVVVLVGGDVLVAVIVLMGCDVFLGVVLL